MPGEIDILILFITSALFWWLFSPIYPGSYFWGPCTVEIALWGQEPNPEGTDLPSTLLDAAHPPSSVEIFPFWCKSFIWEIANVKVKCNERSGNKRKLCPVFLSFCTTLQPFGNVKLFSKICFFGINCMLFMVPDKILSYWYPWFVCLIWVFCKKNREQLLVWTWNLLQTSQFLTKKVQGNILSEKWIVPFNLFNLLGKKTQKIK